MKLHEAVWPLPHLALTLRDRVPYDTRAVTPLRFGLVGWIRSLGRPPWRTEFLRLADGSRLRYAIALPHRRREKGRAIPLVLALHPGWDCRKRPSHGLGARFLRDLVHPGLRDLGAILVAPDCPAEEWTEARSERALVDLMRALREFYPVTPSRSVVVGYGLGGDGAWFMLGRHPELFSASIPIATYPESPWVDGIRSGGVYAIQGQGDELIPLEPTQKAITRLRERGLVADVLVFEALSHSDVRRFDVPLRRAIRWIHGVWRRRRHATV